MVINEPIIGKNVLLRMVEIDDCNEHYIAWMNDPKTNQYMETRYSRQNFDTITAFVKEKRASHDSYLFAIVERCSNRHIGNIKIGPINERYHNADISYFIGEKDCRRKGYATEAIKLVCEFGFSVLKLHRIQAGVASENVASSRVLLACGFSLEGVLKEKLQIDGQYMDHLWYGLLSP